ncbi:MAG: stage V sporulation T C-terminal domain-containing protein [Oscillospiraceae bacterium]
MKATGIVRRIDDLGRVVIPKEIRRTMRIREGDPLEIFTAADGEVIFKKYSPIGELSEFASQYSEVLYRATDLVVLITDRDRVISISGMPKKDLIERRVATDLEGIMDNRVNYIASPDIKSVYPVQGFEKEAAVAFPIIGSGDVSGAVILLLRDDGSMPSPTEIKLAQVAASFLGKQMEE